MSFFRDNIYLKIILNAYRLETILAMFFNILPD